MKVNEIITNQLIQDMQQGIRPWDRPYYQGYTCAISHATKKPYKGTNAILLPYGEYATYKQIQAEGGQVKKGSKSRIAVYWKLFETERQNTRTGKIEKVKIPMLRYYNVFRINDQTEGITPKVKTEIINPLSEDEKITAVENLIREYLNRENIQTEINDKETPYYNPVRDIISMPSYEKFKRVDYFYSTLFHEIGHSTGHQKRLDRFSNSKVFIDHQEKAKEELIAEITASFLNRYIGIESHETKENNIAYLQSWIQALQNDPNMIIQASTKSQKAYDYIISDTESEPEDTEE